ncbi:MAG: PAS domain S-box protein, partial [Enterobacteriaceae bacterium]
MTERADNNHVTYNHVDQLYRLMDSHFDEYRHLMKSQWEEVLSQTHESLSLFISAFNNAAIGMALVAPDGKWLKTNQALSDIVGYSPEELRSCNFQTITYEEDLEKDLSLLNQLMQGKINHYHMEKRYIHRDGHQIWVLLTVSMVKNQDGTPGYFISQIQDINLQKQMETQLMKKQAQLERAQEELIKLAMYDPVTGLANRHMFSARFNSVMSMLRRDGGTFSLAMISIDNFDVYSDAYGALAGEHALQVTAGLLSAELS